VTLDPTEVTQSPHKSGDPLPRVAGAAEAKNPMVGSLPACCARAASGHTAATPPSVTINSRRRNARAGSANHRAHGGCGDNDAEQSKNDSGSILAGVTRFFYHVRLGPFRFL